MTKASAGKEAVFPTKQVEMAMKNKLKGAQSGHSLLKRKSEALTKRFREITAKIADAKNKVDPVMKAAFFSMVMVSKATNSGQWRYEIVQLTKTPGAVVRTRQDNVSGVLLPQFEFHQNEGINEFQLAGLGKGGLELQRCRETFLGVVRMLVELASLQTAFVTLDETIKAVNRRVNSLEHIVIPRTQNTISYIGDELDETEREDMTRIKKISNKKKEATELEDKERQNAKLTHRPKDKSKALLEPSILDDDDEHVDGDVY